MFSDFIVGFCGIIRSIVVGLIFLFGLCLLLYGLIFMVVI